MLVYWVERETQGERERREDPTSQPPMPWEVCNSSQDEACVLRRKKRAGFMGLLSNCFLCDCGPHMEVEVHRCGDVQIRSKDMQCCSSCHRKDKTFSTSILRGFLLASPPRISCYAACPAVVVIHLSVRFAGSTCLVTHVHTRTRAW